jgi:Sulfotransferase family
MYGTAAARVLARGRKPRLGSTDERLIFVVGCPRSGTTFLAGTLGTHPGLVDLGEVKPVKAAIPELAAMETEEAARRFRRTLERVRRLALSAHLRGVEQTPETVFVLSAALRAYPQARGVHLVRDGRDVVCSLLERGWLGGASGTDDVGQAHGAHARFWVEPERREEFEVTSEAARAAWAWRRHVAAGRAVDEDRLLELRYEELASDPAAAAGRLAGHLSLDAHVLAPALAGVHARSVARWSRDLTAEQLADVQREAGPLLRELGYT